MNAVSRAGKNSYFSVVYNAMSAFSMFVFHYSSWLEVFQTICWIRISLARDRTSRSGRKSSRVNSCGFERDNTTLPVFPFFTLLVFPFFTQPPTSPWIKYILQNPFLRGERSLSKSLQSKSPQFPFGLYEEQTFPVFRCASISRLYPCERVSQWVVV